MEEGSEEMLEEAETILDWIHDPASTALLETNMKETVAGRMKRDSEKPSGSKPEKNGRRRRPSSTRSSGRRSIRARRFARR